MISPKKCIPIIGPGALDASVIKGTVSVYSQLPEPASNYQDELWLVTDGSGGFLTVLGVYKYPAGLYAPNAAATEWVLTPLNVKVAEDATTLINVTNWTEFTSYVIDINVGDRIVYGGKTYTNLTGSIGSAPDTDQTNWSSEITFNPQTSPAYLEGKAFYDNTKKALSYYNDISDITVNMGQEVLFRVENQTGSTILNGTVVYPMETTIIGLADCYVKEKCRLIAVATHEIPDGETGYATKLGQVGGLDTSMYSPGQILYLGTAGQLSITAPLDGGYTVIVGIVDAVDGTDGVITVDTSVSALTVEVTDTNGFPSSQRNATTISFVDGTRAFTISPTGDDFHYYMVGDKYEKESSESLVISDVNGMHYIYYDKDTLSEIVNPNSSQIDNLIRTKALIAYIYWDLANSEHIYLGDERHGISMSPETHAYLHFTRGAQYLSGLALNNIIPDDTGDLDAHAQFGVDLGFITDEDLLTNIGAVLFTSGLPIYYLSGASGDLKRQYNAGFSVLTAGTGRLAWNEWTGTAWQLSEITNNDFVLCHIFATNNQDSPMSAFVGQANYPSLSQARSGANNEIANLIIQIPSPEVVPIATIIFQTSTGYGNSVKGRIRTIDTGEEYVDWRVSELAQGSAPTSHSNLSNLELAGVGSALGHVSNTVPLQLPQLTTTERDAFSLPIAGMMIWNTTTVQLEVYNGTAWVAV